MNPEDLVERRQSRRVNAGRPPNRFGYPQLPIPNGSAEDSDDEEDGSVDAHSLTLERSPSASLTTNSTARGRNSMSPSISSVSSVSTGSTVIRGNLSLREQTLAEMDDEQFERMQQLEIRHERERYERRRARYISGATTTEGADLPSTIPVIPEGENEVPTRVLSSHSMIPTAHVPSRPTFAPRSKLRHLLQTYHDTNQLIPDTEILQNYEEFNRPLREMPVLVPEPTSAPLSVATAEPRNELVEAIRELVTPLVTMFNDYNAQARTLHPDHASSDFMRRQKSMRQLPEFNGKPEKWLAFINHYRKTNEKCGFEDFENLIRLQDCLTGEARASVEAILNLPENVPKVIETLETLYGQPQRIIMHLIETAKTTAAPRRGRPDTIVKFSNEVCNMVTTMQQLQSYGDLTNPQLLRELATKLPDGLQEQWCEYSVLISGGADLVMFSEWLTGKAKAASFQTLLRPPIPEDHDRWHDRRGDKRGNQGHAFVGTEATQTFKDSKQVCSICSVSSHQVGECPKMALLNSEGRWRLVKDRKLCFRCLTAGHQISTCRQRNQCEVVGCRKNHHTSLHEPSTAEPGVLLHASTPTSQVLLRIVPVKLFGPRGEICTYALLDEGSTLTLMEHKLAEHLGLSGPTEPLCMKWTHDVVRHNPDSRKVSLGVSGIFQGAKTFTLANVRTVAAMNLPSQSVDMDQLTATWPYLRGVPFTSFKNVIPRLIIGHDNYLLTAPRKIIHSTWTSPVASKTWLGWVIHGSKPANGDIQQACTFTLCEQPYLDLSNLHELVRASFTVENFGVKLTNPTSASKDDLRALSILESSTVRVGPRWQTALLWRNDHVTTPDSKPVARRRLDCLERRMDREVDFAKGYCDKMDDLLAKGYVRKLSTAEIHVRLPTEWHFPHFGVVNANKPGKVRIVFDAAAKTRGVSFNDYMVTGPDYLNSIVAVLWRFRKFKIGFASDIKEMFLRILIPEKDIHSQRFFWRGMDRNKEPDVYAVVVVCFGGTSSPCSANYVKLKNAEEFKDEFPAAYKMVLQQSYMDDYMGGGDNVEEASRVVSDLIEIHKRGGFELCNWTSNSKDLLAAVPVHLRAPGVKDLSPETDIPIERVLGMWWDPEHDFFTYKLHYHKVLPAIKTGAAVPTKRQMLQLVMSIYDPLGFVAFFTIRARILLQDIWRISLGWDDHIKGDTAVRWKKWVQDLQNITTVKINRCYSQNLFAAKSIQLHLFCDASEKAYSAVAYIRIYVDIDDVQVILVGAKTRVSPLKQLSIPRLELQAALMASRLALSITNELEIAFSRTWYWSDSMTVLGWLRNHSRRLKQYVANRVGEILESTNSTDWRWISTKENVADDATRDTSTCNFTQTNRWFSGPSFLKFPETKWPIDVKIAQSFIDKTEFIGTISNGPSYLPDASRFSSYTKLLRVTAWVLRFVAKFQKKNVKVLTFSKSLTPEELEAAQVQWFKRVQTDYFAHDITTLHKGRPLEASSKLLALSPMLNQQGLLVMKGRIDQAACIDARVNQPVILEPNHPFTRLLVHHYHVKLNHQGKETVLNELRQKFWILRFRAAIKSCFRNCQYCKNQILKPSIPEMGNMPNFRLFKKVRPFSYCGMDYFGPLVVKIKKSREKRYGVLFSCMSTRAIHLELAGSLTTDSAINAVRRFIARRGQPIEIYSDNGTNFKGAASELKSAILNLNRMELIDVINTKGIKWNFIPPASPHMGGSWERLIRSVKTALRFSLKETVPTDDTLHTFLIEVEHIVNSRPLTQVSIDPGDLESLTPNHFLLGSSGGAPSTGVIITNPKDLKRQWKFTQLLTDRFWQRWVKEYLPTLARRTKWFKSALPLKVDDVVVIADANGPRNSWPLGRIVTVYPGRDGQVRVADVKTKDGIFRRPVVKLCKLDLDNSNDKDESSSPYGG